MTHFHPNIILLFSADFEWKTWLDIYPGSTIISTPFGESIKHTVDRFPIYAMQGGWGKVSAAAATQWVIDHHQPDLIINLGTCGGLEGRIDRQTIVLVEKTRQYDIREQMADPEEANSFYGCNLSLDWLGKTPLPGGVVRETMYSADRDIQPTDVIELIGKYGARVADWESGAIAWVAGRNQIPLIILRGVTDLVSSGGGEAYGKIEVFQNNTRKILAGLAEQLPWWINTFIVRHEFTSPV